MRPKSWSVLFLRQWLQPLSFPHFNLFFWRKEAGAKGGIDSLKCPEKRRPFVMMAAAVSQLYYRLRQPVYGWRQTSSKVSVQLFKIVNNNKEALFRGTGAIYTGWMTS